VAVGPVPGGRGLPVAMLLGNPFTHDARVEREARTLARLGHGVTVWCPAGEGLPAEESRDGVAVRRVPVPGWISWTGPRRVVPLLRWFSRYDFLARAAEPSRPAVVHGHDLEMLLPAASLAARLGVPFVHDDHEVGLEKLRVQTPATVRGTKRRVLDALTERLVARGEALQRSLLPEAAAVITVSDGCAAMLAPYGVRPVVLRNLPAWSDLPADPRLRERAGLPSAARVALCQGTMTEATAADACVSAARHLPEGWAVVFLGATWMRPILEGQARREGVADRVRFLDRVPPAELPGFTRAADVGLTPVRVLNDSERRGLSNKLFEYLHAGIPCVTTAGTAQAEFVRENRAGEVVEGLEPRDIAAAVVRLGAVRDWSDRLRGLARGKYSWEVEEGRLAEVYEGLPVKR
jgi:glycosyltransferase involved in cell wall biosynthesis